MIKSTSGQSKGTLGFSGKGWRHNNQGSWRGGTSVGTKSGKRKASSLKHSLKGAGGWRTLGSSMVLSPMLSVGQKSEGLGEFILESGQKWVWGPRILDCQE